MRCRQRVGVATDQLPSIALQAEGGRDAQIEWRLLVAPAHLGLPMLALEQCDNVSAVERDLFEPTGMPSRKFDDAKSSACETAAPPSEKPPKGFARRPFAWIADLAVARLGVCRDAKMFA